MAQLNSGGKTSARPLGRVVGRLTTAIRKTPSLVGIRRMPAPTSTTEIYKHPTDAGKIA